MMKRTTEAEAKKAEAKLQEVIKELERVVAEVVHPLPPVKKDE